MTLAILDRLLLALAAALAVVVARRAREHRPLAIFLGAQTALMLLRLAWRPVLVAAIAAAGGDMAAGIRPPAPLTGWGRAVGIADLACWLAWPAGLATLALRMSRWPVAAVTPGGPWGASWTSYEHRAAAARREMRSARWDIWLPTILWGAVVVWLCATYPGTRGRTPSLCAGAELAAVLVALASGAPVMVRRWRALEGLSPTALCVAALVLIEAGTMAGAYVWGLSGAAWDLDRAMTATGYGFVIVVQGGTLWTTRRR